MFVGEDSDVLVLKVHGKCGKVAEPAFVDDQTIKRIAYADAPGLGVENDCLPLCSISGLVKVCMNDAGSRFNYRYRCIFAYIIDQVLAAPRDDDVNKTHSVEQRRCRLAIGWKQGDYTGVYGKILQYLMN